MYLSLKWLREFTPYDGSVERLAERLTMLGLEVEEITRPFVHLQNIVVGRVVETRQHPGADRLSLCRVDAGQGELLPIVCGAPNVAPDQFVAVALPGTALPDGKRITRAKIRGESSRGMICSEVELGLGEENDGIMVLDGPLVPGQDMLTVMDLDDWVLNISITPNRGDCLSMVGLAREVAVEFNLPMTLPDTRVIQDGPSCADALSITIDDPDLCPLYQAGIIRGIAVAPSPPWLRHRLLTIGQRPINNVVDVTNYILMEWGQPLHAFDRGLLSGNSIRVARAREEQSLVTLDGRTRRLLPADLLIWDAEKPVALAGVMGGANSEVTQTTTDILLECAVFNPISIRKTSRRLSLTSEASFRFERGVDQPGSRQAMNRALALIRQTAGGTVMQGIAAHEPHPWQPPRLVFRPARAKKILGVDLQPEFCRQKLAALGCAVDVQDAQAWRVQPPGFRPDLEREADLIEEVGRCHGLDRIPATLPRTARSLDWLHSLAPDTAFRKTVKHWARGIGLTEAINYSFVSSQDLALMGLDRIPAIGLRNPLSEDQNVLRPMLAPGLLQSVRHNMTQGNTTLRLFETSVIFQPDPDSETGALEPSRLGLALTGNRHPEGWPWPMEFVDFADIKGCIDHLLRHLHLPHAAYAPLDEHPICLPCAGITLGGEMAGWLGRVKSEIADHCHVRRDLFLAELDLTLVQRWHAQSRLEFKALPKFPPVRRDMTLIAPPDLALCKILEAIQAEAVDLLQEILLIDRFVPLDKPEARLTLRLTYRHQDRSLTNEEVDKTHQKLSQRLASLLPVRFS
ncbi:MAG TPA: phenylalanine--tRNA ligase subunit beta [Desulfonatronum sp.]|nr:phenylalanine--tRNA ligase subunit beta [Desulfonatronum sp.]